MPNVRIQSPVANIGIRSPVVNVRVSSFQTGRSGESSSQTDIVAGTPIGLLLVLTYATDQTSAQTLTPYGDLRPNVRITTS